MNTPIASASPFLRVPAALAGWDGASRLVLVFLTVVVILTFPDYGITWDEPRQQRYGELALRYYLSLGTDQGVLSYFDLYLYGAAFDLVVSALQLVSPLEPYDTRHLVNALVGLAGLAASWRLARELAGPRAGFLALVLLAANPDWYGHMFNNPKDIPFGTAMTWATYYLVRVARTLPQPRMGTVLKFGLTAGLAMGVRVGGGLLWVYAGALVLAWALFQTRATGWRPALRVAAPMGLSFAVAGVLAGTLMLALWPWAQQSPVTNPLAAVHAFARFAHDETFVYAGELVRSTDLPWHYLPVMLLVRVPEPVILGSLLVPLLILRFRGWGKPDWLGWGVVTLAILVPLALVLGTDAVLYDGLRHVLFLVPLVTIAAAAALDRLFASVHSQQGREFLMGLGVVWLGFQAAQFVDIHPYQYVLYNRVAGGVEEAAGRFELDFWGSSLKETTETLVQTLVDEYGEDVLSKPLRVLVCGPYDSVRPYVPKEWRLLDWRSGRPADLFVALPKIPCRLPSTARVLVRTVREDVLLSSAGTVREALP
jgi:hypothetical protein